MDRTDALQIIREAYPDYAPLSDDEIIDAFEFDLDTQYEHPNPRVRAAISLIRGL